MQPMKSQEKAVESGKAISRFTSKVLALALGAGLCATMTFSASAQSQEQVPAAGQETSRHGGHRMHSVDDQLKRMTKKLNLNDEQQSKVKAVLESQQSQMQQLRNDSSVSREDRFAKMRELHENSNSQIRAALNDEQQKKFDEMQAKRRERMERHKGMNAPATQQPSTQPQ
jgi:Spy/CpxP family protein refolding chaperone